MLFANGVYDILCTVSILWLSNIPGFRALSGLHVSMFKEISPLAQRLLAYWIFTYGLVRLMAAIYDDVALGAVTYFVESIVFEYELHTGASLVLWKTRFVSVLSLVLGIVILTA